MASANQPQKRTVEWTVSTRTVLRILVIATIFLIGLQAAVILKNQIAWIVISFFLALALTPAVDWLSRFMPRKSRGLAMAIVLIITIALLAYLLIVLIPPVVDQLTNLVKNFPDYWDSFLRSDSSLASFARDLNVSELVAKNQDKVASVAGNVGGILGGVAGGLFALITIFTLTFFMVVEGHRWTAIFWRYQKPSKRAKRQALAIDMYKTVTGYVGGNVATSGIATVATTAFLLIIGIPSPFALGLVVGVVDLIPLIGATVGAVIVSLFALVYGGPGAGIASVIFFIVYQQIENNLLQPLIYSKSVRISPLVVGISAICGAVLAGFVGALVAIPVAASCQILVKHFLDNREEFLNSN